jgi:hypothetical protein
MPAVRDVEGCSSAFATTTIVHFASFLLLSAIISAPRHGLIPPQFSGEVSVCLKSCMRSSQLGE